MKQNDMKSALIARIVEQSDRLYRLAFSYVRNEQDAMDIVQETACKALKNQGKLRDAAYLDTWLYRMTINAAIDFLRRRKRETVGLPVIEEGREDDYANLYVLDLLDRLDEKSRAVVILRMLEDRTLPQIAEILGENQNTVKTRLYKALKLLRMEFDMGEAEEHVR